MKSSSSAGDPGDVKGTEDQKAVSGGSPTTLKTPSAGPDHEKKGATGVEPEEGSSSSKALSSSNNDDNNDKTPTTSASPPEHELSSCTNGGGTGGGGGGVGSDKDNTNNTTNSMAPEHANNNNIGAGDHEATGSASPAANTPTEGTTKSTKCSADAAAGVEEAESSIGGGGVNVGSVKSSTRRSKNEENCRGNQRNRNSSSFGSASSDCSENQGDHHHDRQNDGKCKKGPTKMMTTTTKKTTLPNDDDENLQRILQNGNRSPTSCCGVESDTASVVTAADDSESTSGIGTSEATTSEAAFSERAESEMAGGESVASSELAAVENLRKTMEMLRMNFATSSSGPAKSIAQAVGKKYQFWSTQPVPKIDETITTNEAIDKNLTKDQIRKEPYSLPEQFTWCTVDLQDEGQLRELYQLLNENYVEDDDNMFRFDYAPEFLKWALMPPGWLRQWHVGVRVAKSGKLVGFISAVPAHIRVHDKLVRMSEVNFLCVHKKLRSKRVAPVLIREITRRCNLEGIFQAAYTAGVVLPKPVGVCRYWHRSLNPKKLIEVKFSHLTRNMTMQRTLKLHKLPDQPKIVGFRPFVPATDAKQAFALLTNYLKRFELAPQFTLEEFLHWFTPRPGVVVSYVVADRSDKVKDFVSFYSLPSSIMHHPVHKSLQAAYSFYAVANSVSLVELMSDALIVAKNAGYDVFNALDLMDNKEFLEELKFGIGDGNLQYYLYNWRCPPIEPEKIGLVLQ